MKALIPVGLGALAILCSCASKPLTGEALARAYKGAASRSLEDQVKFLTEHPVRSPEDVDAVQELLTSPEENVRFIAAFSVAQSPFSLSEDRVRTYFEMWSRDSATKDRAMLILVEEGAKVWRPLELDLAYSTGHGAAIRIATSYYHALAPHVLRKKLLDLSPSQASQVRKDLQEKTDTKHLVVFFDKVRASRNSTIGVKK